MNLKKIKDLEQGRSLAVILAGGLGGLAVIRDLGKSSVPTIVLSSNDYDIKSRYSSWGMKINSLDGIIDFLCELPQHIKNKPVLFTDCDQYLDLLYKNWDRIKDLYYTPMHIHNQFLTDKTLLFRSARKAEIPVPETYLATDEVKKFPVIVKPLNGVAHINNNLRKGYECKNQTELNSVLKLLNNQHIQFVIQQVIPGNVETLYGVTIYRSFKREVIIGNVAKKVRQYPHNNGTGTSHVTCKESKLVDYSMRLLESAKYIGVAEIEYKYCAELNDYFVIEVNGRFPLHTGIMHKMHNSFVYEIYQDLTDCIEKKIPEVSPENKEIFWTFLFKDLFSASSLPSLISNYLYHLQKSKIQGAIFEWSDLKPLLFFYKYLCKKLWFIILDHFKGHGKRV